MYTDPTCADRPMDGDARADVYSLGMTILLGFCGVDLPPWVHGNHERSIRSLSMPYLIRQALLRATELEDREHRFSDAGDLREALQEAMTCDTQYLNVGYSDSRRCTLWDASNSRIASPPAGAPRSVRRSARGHAHCSLELAGNRAGMSWCTSVEQRLSLEVTQAKPLRNRRAHRRGGCRPRCPGAWLSCCSSALEPLVFSGTWGPCGARPR